MIWPLPKVNFTKLNEIEERRPVALLTSDDAWSQVGHLMDLPLIVQAEPVDHDQELMDYLAEHLPSQTEVVYVVGNGVPLTAGKVVASANNLPLVVVPTAIDSDAIFESFVAYMKDGLMTRQETGPPNEVIIDWEVIEAAPAAERTGAVVDILAIVTALLDWRYAAKNNRNIAEHKFSAWGAGVAAGLASQAIKSARAIGEGKVEAMRTLVDLVMMSVQLAHQLGHDRHQEGTEHYLVYSLQNQGATFKYAEAVGSGILLASALHGQDPNALKDALEAAGLGSNQLRAGDVRLAINDLPTFCATNDLPYSIAHDLDPLSDEVAQALDKAGLLGDDDGSLTPPVAATEVTEETGAETTEQPSTEADAASEEESNEGDEPE